MECMTGTMGRWGWVAPRWNCGSLKPVEVMSLYSLGLEFNQICFWRKHWVKIYILSCFGVWVVFWVWFCLFIWFFFYKVGFCGYFAHSWTFISQEIQTHVVCYCEEIMTFLNFLTFHCIHSFSKFCMPIVIEGTWSVIIILHLAISVWGKLGPAVATGVHNR